VEEVASHPPEAVAVVEDPHPLEAAAAVEDPHPQEEEESSEPTYQQTRSATCPTKPGCQSDGNEARKLRR